MTSFSWRKSTSVVSGESELVERQGDILLAHAEPGEAGETSDRTPDKATQFPQNQQETAGGKTSDRSQNKDVKVQPQPGAAGTAGSESSSEGASTGAAGKTGGSKTTTPSTTPPASSGSSK